MISQAEEADLPAIDELAKLLYGSGLPPTKAVRLDSRTFVARTPEGVKG